MVDRASDEDISRLFFQCAPSEMARTVVLTVADRTREFEACLDSVSKRFLGFHRGLTGRVADGGEVSVVVGGKGAAPIGDATLALARAGCRHVIFHGFVGALAEGIELGDLLVATEAADGGGFPSYVGGAPPDPAAAPPHAAGEHALGTLRTWAAEEPDRLPVSTRFGPIFSIGSFLAESRAYVESIAAAGFHGIEMETAAFYAAARAGGIDAVAVHSVTDRPMQRTLFAKIPFDRRRIRAHKELPRTLLELAGRTGG